jgi:hypothetical protein
MPPCRFEVYDAAAYAPARYLLPKRDDSQVSGSLLRYGICATQCVAPATSVGVGTSLGQVSSSKTAAFSCDACVAAALKLSNASLAENGGQASTVTSALLPQPGLAYRWGQGRQEWQMTTMWHMHHQVSGAL